MTLVKYSIDRFGGCWVLNLGSTRAQLEAWVQRSFYSYFRVQRGLSASFSLAV